MTAPLTHYVYMIVNRKTGMPLYVGCSKFPRKRIRNPGHPFLLIGWKRGRLVVDGPYTEGEAFQREAALISHLRPKHNIDHNPEARRDLKGVPLRLWAHDTAVWFVGMTRLSMAQVYLPNVDREGLDLLWDNAPEMPTDWLIARDSEGKPYVRPDDELSWEELMCLGRNRSVRDQPAGYVRDAVAHTARPRARAA